MTKKHTIRDEGKVTILELNGKVMGDTDDTALFNLVYELAEQDKVNVVIDLCNVEWMNSKGLGICISGATTFRNRGGDLKLACVSEKVESLLSKTRMFAVFEVFKTVDEAVKSFK
jgi:anti-sigma B factor antagonist